MIARIMTAEIATTIKATAEPVPKSYIEKLSFQIWKDKQRRRRAGTAAGHGVDKIIGREGCQRIVDQQHHDHRLDLGKDHMPETPDRTAAIDRRGLERLGIDGRKRRHGEHDGKRYLRPDMRDHDRDQREFRRDEPRNGAIDKPQAREARR